MTKNWKYLFFVLPGIISFIIGFDFFELRNKILSPFENFLRLPDISGFLEFLLSLLIMIILFFIFLLVFKERRIPFIIKSFSISLFTLIILFFLFFSFALKTATYLNVERIEEMNVINYITVSNDELENFPALKNAIETIISENISEYSSKISDREGEKIDKFLENKNTNIIKYSGFYFKIGIAYAD